MFLPASLRRGSVLLPAAALALLGAAAPAADAAPKKGLPMGVKVASPSPNALVKTRTVPVRLDVRANVTTVKVWDGTKDVTRAFKRTGKAYVARLPLAPGAHKLLVQAQAGKRNAGATTVRFSVAREVQNLLTVRSGAKTPIASGPAQTRSYRPTPGQVPVAATTRTRTWTTLTVNGHQVADLRRGRQRTAFSWLVSARDGLKTGRNVFVVNAYDAKGRHQVKRWIVRRTATLPLAEAGPREQIAKPNQAVKLDGTGSKATRRGAQLRYAWRVVNAPKGAKPRLQNANSAKPTFTADVPGVYQVALRATHVGQGATAAQAAPTGGASEDVTTVSVAPQPVSTQGLYVDTGLFGADPSNKESGPFTTLYVNGTGYSFPVGYGYQNFVQLDDTTLAVVASGTQAQVQPAAGTFTIGVWQNSTVSISGDQWGSVVYVGTDQVAYNATANGEDPDSGNPTTALHGFLQQSTATGAPNWVGSDMLSVATRSTTDTTTSNTMTINGTQYAQSVPSGSTGGYHLIVLGNDGGIIWNQAYAMTGNATTDGATEDQIAQDIQQWPGADGTTVLLQGFGALTSLPTTGNLANAIQNIGGRADVVSRFNGKTDSTGGAYALIAGNASKSLQTSWSPGHRGEETSFERTGSNASLSAQLVRDPATNNFIPYTSDADAPDAGRYAFLPAIYAAPTHYSAATMFQLDGTLVQATPAQQAAYNDIAAEAKADSFVGAPLCPNQTDPIRGYYCNTDAGDIDELSGEISLLTYNATTANGRYTAADFAAVQTSLKLEMGWVADIRNGVKDFQTLFGNAQTAGTVPAGAIAAVIKQNIDSVNTTAQSNQLAVASALTDMMSVLPGVGPAMTFMSGSLSLASSLMPDSNPGPDLDTAVTTSQATAETDIVAAYQKASDHISRLGDYLVQDPAKLVAGARFFSQTAAPTSDSNSSFTIASEYAMQRYLWGTMLAPAYTAWVGQGLWGTNPYCQQTNDAIGNPWNNLDVATGTWPSGIGTGANHSDWMWLLGFDKNGGTSTNAWGWESMDLNHGTFNPTGMPPSLTQRIFGAINPKLAPSQDPKNPTNVGAVMPYFALDYLPMKFIPAIPHPNYNGKYPVGNGCMKDNT